VIMDDTTKKALKDFILKKLGIFGAFEFRRDVQKCECKPCKTLLQLIAEIDDEKNSSKAGDTQSK
jgi:hypothetical protein